MALRNLRSRLLDLAVATACIACVAAPLLPVVNAATESDRSVIESGATVDQRVVQNGLISDPLGGDFSDPRGGSASGSISWELGSSSADGMKLVVSADRTPAMRDPQSGTDIADAPSALGPWSASSGPRFGFSAVGDMVLKRFDDGDAWRGFDGRRGIEVARRSGVFGVTRTTLKFRADYGNAVSANARPTANIRMTAVANL